jgi:hypothetical protein
MWLKRYIIIVPTLASPFMPIYSIASKPVSYVPTWVEWSITAGAFSGFCMLYLLFSKVFPIVSIWELEEGEDEKLEHAPQALPSSETVLTSSRRAGLVTTLLIAAAVVLCVSGRSSAQATQPTATMTLKVVTEDDQKSVQGTLIGADGKPIENATVDFYVARTFGNMKLGEDKTLDDGTAAAKYPVGLPGGTTGKLSFLAQVKTPDQYAAVSAHVSDNGGKIVPLDPDPYPRALWSPYAPFGLLALLGCLLGGVWTTYAFVVSQIIAIKKGGAV